VRQEAADMNTADMNTAGLLRPLLDDFSFDRTELGVTRLTGEIRDSTRPSCTA
jgi:hypothetical protein